MKYLGSIFDYPPHGIVCELIDRDTGSPSYTLAPKTDKDGNVLEIGDKCDVEIVEKEFVYTKKYSKPIDSEKLRAIIEAMDKNLKGKRI